MEIVSRPESKTRMVLTTAQRGAATCPVAHKSVPCCSRTKKSREVEMIAKSAQMALLVPKNTAVSIGTIKSQKGPLAWVPKR